MKPEGIPIQKGKNLHWAEHYKGSIPIYEFFTNMCLLVITSAGGPEGPLLASNPLRT
jgi:hypothetical protein